MQKDFRVRQNKTLITSSSAVGTTVFFFQRTEEWVYLETLLGDFHMTISHINEGNNSCNKGLYGQLNHTHILIGSYL